MRVLLKTLLPFVLVLGFGCSKAEPDSESGPPTIDEKPKYQIDLAPRWKVGSRLKGDMRSEFSSRVAVKVNGDTVEETSATASLEAKADLEVLTIDSKGEPTGVKFTVRTSNARVDGKTVGAIPPGTVVESRRVTGKEPAKGLPFALDPEINRLAENMFAASTPEDTTDQDIFGATEPRSVGERWEINKVLFREAISSAGFSFRDAKLSAFGTLAGLEKVNGVECFHVRAEAHLNNFDVELPKELKLEKATADITFDTYIAVDGGQELKDEGVFDIEVITRAANGASAVQNTLISYSETFELPE